MSVYFLNGRRALLQFFDDLFVFWYAAVFSLNTIKNDHILIYIVRNKQMLVNLK